MKRWLGLMTLAACGTGLDSELQLKLDASSETRASAAVTFDGGLDGARDAAPSDAADLGEGGH